MQTREFFIAKSDAEEAREIIRTYYTEESTAIASPELFEYSSGDASVQIILAAEAAELIGKVLGVVWIFEDGSSDRTKLTVVCSGGKGSIIGTAFGRESAAISKIVERIEKRGILLALRGEKEIASEPEEKEEIIRLDEET